MSDLIFSQEMTTLKLWMAWLSDVVFLPLSIDIYSLWRELLTSHLRHHRRRRFGIYSTKALLWSSHMAQSILILIQSKSKKSSLSSHNEYEWEIASCLKNQIKIFRISLFIIYILRKLSLVVKHEEDFESVRQRRLNWYAYFIMSGT